ncbi:molybdenum cofactor guanylyltransferase [Domibacillus mangrovi]|uniref:Probable molybdenum cofactor guanylyltransferase n=1 Tax=Domibacillus mangrovi TaxID=1714354 RepID=A0A1Q5P5C2_9BACI|nr:molybdenum cofactor guanylyltransferase [Domibacillus mangrovi]OKL37470.1 molybdenum cofactor guanylyltransferase [Domibacillus mangrovi]
MNIAGVVLAGGRSSRYGKPKMFELYNGKSFYQYSIDALKENNLAPIIISTNDMLARHFDAVSVTLSIEKEHHQGPLFALHHVMKSVPEPDWFFVLSSDVPFVTSNFVKQMITFTKNGDYKAIVPVQNEKSHPLLALYHRDCLEPADHLLKQNKRSMAALLNSVLYKKIAFNKEEPSFLNINSPSDFEELRKG